MALPETKQLKNGTMLLLSLIPLHGDLDVRSGVLFAWGKCALLPVSTGNYITHFLRTLELPRCHAVKQVSRRLAEDYLQKKKKNV